MKSFSFRQTLGAVTLDLFPMGTLGVTAWVGFTLGYDGRLRFHACKLPKGKLSVGLFWRETYL